MPTVNDSADPVERWTAKRRAGPVLAILKGETTIVEAARLCEEAQGEQILISQQVHAAVEEVGEAEPVGEQPLEGFRRAIPAYNVSHLRR